MKSPIYFTDLMFAHPVVNLTKIMDMLEFEPRTVQKDTFLYFTFSLKALQ